VYVTYVTAVPFYSVRVFVILEHTSVLCSSNNELCKNVLYRESEHSGHSKSRDRDRVRREDRRSKSRSRERERER
jgi:hypothetical protein